jgi:glycerophosphoryl diester phosphodiesterase
LRVSHIGHQIGRKHAHRLTVRVPVGHIYRVSLIRHRRSVAHVHVICHRPAVKKRAPAPAKPVSVAKPAVCSDPSFGAHRGGSADAAGDSDLAFERSYAAGARNEDTDIRFTSDDQPILLHEPSFADFGHPEALAADTPLATAQTYAATDGGKVWTLPQFAAWLVDRSAVTLTTAELKTHPTEAEYQTLTTDLAPVRSRVAVVSFTGSDLPPMAQAGFRTGLIYSTASWSPSKDVSVSTIGSYGTLAQIDLNNLSASLVTQLRAEGVATIESWVNPGAAQYLRNPAGVIPLVDDVPGYLAWRKANC